MDWLLIATLVYSKGNPMKRFSTTLIIFALTSVANAQDVSLWNGGVANPSGDVAVPSVRYEPTSGIMFIDSRGVNRNVDSEPLSPGSNFVDIAGDDVALLSLIIEGPQPTSQILLEGFEFGISWNSQYFAQRQQLFGITVESEFLQPGIHALYGYEPNLTAADFGEVEIGVNFGPTQPGAILFGGIEIVNVDLDFDSAFGCADIDALSQAIADGNPDPQFDLNGDGVVNPTDQQLWLELAGTIRVGAPFLPGDANLDGFVDVSDFNVWNENRFGESTAWCTGDFNTDGVTDVSDFNIWNERKFTGSNAASVPEPASYVLIGFALLGLVSIRRIATGS